MQARRYLKLSQLLEHNGVPVFQGHPHDIIVPVMGPSGAGKSTFINSLLTENQSKMAVGHCLLSCTSQLTPVPLDSHLFPAMGRFEHLPRLVIVDTPGFDDTYIDDVEILRRISDWLAESYTAEMKLGGVIYLHDISLSRVMGATRKNLNMFKKLVGRDALDTVMLGTSKWDLISDEVGISREKQLTSVFWAELLEAGSTMFRLDETRTSPIEIINTLLQRIDSKMLSHRLLKIQDEVVNLKKIIPETDAGKELKHSIEKLIKDKSAEVQRLSTQARRSQDPLLYEELDTQRRYLDSLRGAQKMLCIPFSRRVKEFFDQKSLSVQEI